MSERENQPPAPSKRRRPPRAKAEGKNHPAQHAGASIPGAQPEPRSSATRVEPPVGEKWGEFPTPERQDVLKGMLEKWEHYHGDRPGPFAGFVLNGADVFWLAARAAGEGNIDAGQHRLSDPDLLILDLSNLHLEGAIFSVWQSQDANFVKAQLQNAILQGAHLEGSYLLSAQLQGARLKSAHLQGANLGGAQLQDADLPFAQLQGANLSTSNLRGANLRWAKLDGDTNLIEPRLDDRVRVADTAWNDASLIRIEWEQVPRLGDEAEARQAKIKFPYKQRPGIKSTPYRLREYQEAGRAYRQLALALRGQGITEAADRFTYRALIMQRKALWWQMRKGKLSKLGAYLFSLFLALLTSLPAMAFGWSAFSSPTPW
jgi:uncharacterized protein YjbI with pentapeptide repeats